MSIPKDLAKKRDDLLKTHKEFNPVGSPVEFYYSANPNYFIDGFNAGVLAALSSEHVLALVEALIKWKSCVDAGFIGSSDIAQDLSITDAIEHSREALAKWSKRNE